MGQQKIIHLRIYKAKAGFAGIAKSETGKVLNENQLVKMKTNTLEWDNWLKHLLSDGIIKIDCVGYFLKMNEDDSGFIYEDVDEAMRNEIDNALHKKVDVKLTSEQKRIQELEKKIDALMSNGKAKKPVKEVEKPVKIPVKDIESNGLDEAKAEYKKVFGKKAHHSWSIEKIKEKIENK